MGVAHKEDDTTVKTRAERISRSLPDAAFDALVALTEKWLILERQGLNKYDSDEDARAARRLAGKLSEGEGDFSPAARPREAG